MNVPLIYLTNPPLLDTWVVSTFSLLTISLLTFLGTGVTFEMSNNCDGLVLDTNQLEWAEVRNGWFVHTMCPPLCVHISFHMSCDCPWIGFKKWNFSMDQRIREHFKTFAPTSTRLQPHSHCKRIPPFHSHSCSPNNGSGRHWDGVSRQKFPGQQDLWFPIRG